MEIKSMRDPNAQKSPLARTLFQVEGVESVLFSTNFVTVNKNDSIEWDLLKPHIFAALMGPYNALRTWRLGGRNCGKLTLGDDDDDDYRLFRQRTACVYGRDACDRYHYLAGG